MVKVTKLKLLKRVVPQSFFMVAASLLTLLIVLNLAIELRSNLNVDTIENNIRYKLEVNKIAFLFLTRDNLLTPKVWDKFFGNDADKKYYNVYVHCKYPENISVNQPYLYHNKLTQNITIQNTSRLDFSLVQASNVLLKTAFEDDPSNKKFVLLSESHIPLYSFKALYSRLMERDAHADQSYIADYRSIRKPQLVAGRYNIIKNHYLRRKHHHNETYFERRFVKLKHFFPSNQWIILDRYLIGNYLLKYETYWNPFFKHSYASDENYYSTLFRKFLNRTQWHGRISLNCTTYAEIVRGKIGPESGHAREFSQVTDEFIFNLRSQYYLFLRKTNQESDINVSYLLL